MREDNEPVVGKRFSFGTYGGQKIEWIVLNKNEDKAFLISRADINEQCFREDSNADDADQWAVSDIRSWLNKDFLEKAFSAEEQKQIIETELWTSGFDDTKDRIFLLSVEEVEHYFKTEGKILDVERGNWWTRSSWNQYVFSGKHRSPQNNALFSVEAIFLDEIGYACSFVYDKCAVRPALWMRLES